MICTNLSTNTISTIQHPRTKSERSEANSLLKRFNTRGRSPHGAKLIHYLNVSTILHIISSTNQRFNTTIDSSTLYSKKTSYFDYHELTSIRLMQTKSDTEL